MTRISATIAVPIRQQWGWHIWAQPYKYDFPKGWEFRTDHRKWACAESELRGQRFQGS